MYFGLVNVCLLQDSLSTISCFRWSFADTAMKTGTWILTTTSAASWGWMPCVVSLRCEMKRTQWKGKIYQDSNRDRQLVPFPHSGAFKTLDKDNNGTIKVNVQEVTRDLNEYWFWNEKGIGCLYKTMFLSFPSGFSWRCTPESGRGPSDLFFATVLLTNQCRPVARAVSLFEDLHWTRPYCVTA